MDIKEIQYEKYTKVYMSTNNWECDHHDIQKYIMKNDMDVLYSIVYTDENGHFSIKDTVLVKKYMRPVMFLNGQDVDGVNEVNGVLIIGIINKKEKVNILKVMYDGQLIGTKLTTDNNEEMYIVGLYSKEQTFVKEMDEVYNKIQLIAKENGFLINDIYRTYFYLRHLLKDYQDFNESRDAFFEKNQINSKSYPASTCIMGNSVFGESVISAFFFSKLKYDIMNTNKQCEAADYNKRFSRGVIIQDEKILRGYISGTASIDKNGKTLYINQIEKQIEHTIQCVIELLKNRQMSIEDIVCCNIYLKEDNKSVLEHVFKKLKILRFPYMCMRADVCRDDLLVEIDLIAERKI